LTYSATQNKYAKNQHETNMKYTKTSKNNEHETNMKKQWGNGQVFNRLLTLCTLNHWVCLLEKTFMELGTVQWGGSW